MGRSNQLRIQKNSGVSLALPTVTVLFITLYSFWGNKPYFSWETYKGGRYSNIAGVPITTIWGVLSVISIVALLFAKRKVKISDMKFSAAIMLISIGTVLISGGMKHAFSLEWLIYIVPACFLLIPKKYQQDAYELYKLLFVLTLILPIIYYVLNIIGIHVPYSSLESYEAIKISHNNYYKVYPILGAQFTHRYNPFLSELRMSGIYDESGRLGTLAGLFLVSERFKIKHNWMNIIILIGGIFSFSLAFYMIVLLYFLIIIIQNRNTKRIAVIIGIAVAYFVFISFDYSNPVLSYLKSRFLITSEGLSGDNRTSEGYLRIYNTLYSGSLFRILFGYGYGALGELRSLVMADGSSYKTLIYDFGYIGFLSQLIWLFAFSFKKWKWMNQNSRWQCVSVFLVYLLNMYQRPTMFNMYYLLIFFGGILKQEEVQELPSAK